jgi:hypothetical protein
MKNICKNPDCSMKYEVENEKVDLGCCSFECWEKLNCKIPEKIEFPELILE